jgi:hypothetical protein
MQLKIKSPENFWSGLLFTAFGVIVVVISRGYPMGDSTHMGPGYFPRYVGIVLSILGVIITLTSFRIEGEKIKPFAWKGIVLITLAFSFFGWAIDHVGLVLALFVMIFCSALAGKTFKLSDVLIMCIVLIAGSVILFIYALKLPFPLFWWR